MRGYGHTDSPLPVSSYSFQTILADMLALMDTLGHSSAILAGHDFGAGLAWFFAVHEPLRFPALVILSVPPGGLGCWSDTSPIDGLVASHGENYFYQLCHVEDYEAGCEYSNSWPTHLNLQRGVSRATVATNRRQSLAVPSRGLLRAGRG